MFACPEADPWPLAFCSGTTLGIVEVDPMEVDVGTPVWVSRAKMAEDLKFRGAISDFGCCKDALKALPAECARVPFLINENDKFGDGNNWIILATAEAIAKVREHMERIADPEKFAALEAAAAPAAGSAEDEGEAEPEAEPEPVFTLNEDELFGEGSANDVPAGYESLFLTAATLKIVEIDESAAQQGMLVLVNRQKVLDDIQFRGAISDFTAAKKQIEKLDSEMMAMLYNPNDKFGDGNNWVLVLSAELQQSLEDNIIQQREAYEEAKRLEREEAERIAREKAERKANRGRPKAKPWVELGSAAELEARQVVPQREPSRMAFSRARRDFGGALKLSDRDAAELWSSGQMECRPHKDPNFELRRMEMERGVQGVAATCEQGVQAAPGRPRNGATQWAPLALSAAERHQAQRSSALAAFLEGPAATLLRDALQQNELADVFEDDLAALAEEDSAPGNKLENVISEYQSFTDLTYSKSKVVSAVDWQPGSRGVVAVACTERLSFDGRLQGAGSVGTSAVLVWNFADPIHPQLVLESPADVMAFKFNPRRPDLVAGGMYNGQVALWDTRKVEKRGGKQDALATADEDQGALVSVCVCSRLSGVESSHKMPITDLAWLPGDMEVGRGGRTSASSTGETACFATLAADGRLLFWDCRVDAPGSRVPSRQSKKGDPVWAPVHAVPLVRLDGGGDLGALKLNFAPPGASDPSRFFVTSEDGDVVFATFDKGGAAAPGGVAGGGGPGAAGAPGAPGGASSGGAAPSSDQTMLWSTDAHCGPVKAVSRSPFFKDVVMTVADFSFRVWREGISTPIFASAASSTYLTAGCWSPTRPGVLFVARADGLLEIWDLLDRSHEPSMVATVAGSAVMCLSFWAQTNPQLLAAGDESGVLHIVEIPRNLRRPVAGEQATMAAFLSREEARVAYFTELVQGRGGAEAAARASALRDKASGAVGEGAGEGSDEAIGGGDGELEADDEAEIKADEKLYQQMLAAFKAELGIAEA